MTQPSRDILITDVDNTIYNFVDFFAVAFRSMVHTLSKMSGVAESELYDGFRELYADYSSIEAPQVVAKLSCFSTLDTAAISSLEKAARRSFDLTRKKHLVLYKDIDMVFSILQSRDVFIVAVTNSPLYQVSWRLGPELRFLDRISAIVATDDHIMDSNLRDREKAARRRAQLERKLSFVATYPRERQKPDCHPFELALERLPFPVRNAYALGDNERKDLDPAKRFGATTILAEYGSVFEKANWDTLLRITPWTGNQIRSHQAAAKVPDFSVEQPKSLLSIIEGTQRTLFDYAEAG